MNSVGVRSKIDPLPAVAAEEQHEHPHAPTSSVETVDESRRPPPRVVIEPRRIVLRAHDRTLTESDAAEVRERAIAELAALGASIRG